HGLFFRKPTPGNFMLRLRMEAGQTDARQLRLIADLSDEYGKGFCDLTTRQQIQLRWFTLGDVPDIWRRLEDVGLHSKQTGMDNVRGVCGCPVAGLTPHELLEDRGVSWFRAELERRWGEPLLRAGTDLRKKHHVDHLGIHPQKQTPHHEGPSLYYVGLLVPVGRITTVQLRGVADLAERYGD